MKLIVGKPKKCSEVLHLFLEKEGEEVCLKAQQSDGSSYYVMSFDAKGTFHRCACVSADLGLELDSQGRIIERKAWSSLDKEIPF